MFRILARSVRTGIVTDASPLAPRLHPGFPVVDFARCTACGDCARACPTGAISHGPLEGTAPGTEAARRFSLAYGACIGCRECIRTCPEGVIAAGSDHELVAYTRGQLTRRATFDVDPVTGRAAFRGEEGAPGPSLAQSAEALAKRIRGRFGRSLHVRQVDAGSCNGCELEIAATANPVFDLERFGIHFVASPRHADLLLVTGPVTRNMEIALRRTLEATPEPRVVVAVGACGCTGGIFGEGTYASLGGVDRVLPVDVYVPGCPPTPRAILAGLFVAMGLRDARSRPEGTAGGS
ncbi:MAG TPA: NADH-quinone oxidoreductase subunit NuoB [Vicinamibacteria bacterium]|nr:NADH-quinone oxidoreductase subunit NuoB [Vicinamibacteria bacterium]